MGVGALNKIGDPGGKFEGYEGVPSMIICGQKFCTHGFTLIEVFIGGIETCKQGNLYSAARNVSFEWAP